MYDVNAVQRENIDSTESVWLCINWKWLFWKHRYFWLVLDSRIMVMNWLWIWIWRLCAPIAKLILSGCLFYKCLSHYHVTSAVQKQRSSIHRPLSPLHDQYKGGTKLEFKRHDFKNSTDSLEIHIRARWSRTAYRYEPHHGRWRVFFFLRLRPSQRQFWTMFSRILLKTNGNTTRPIPFHESIPPISSARATIGTATLIHKWAIYNISHIILLYCDY